MDPNIKATALAFAVEVKSDDDDFEEVMQMAREIYEWLVQKEGNVVEMREMN